MTIANTQAKTPAKTEPTNQPRLKVTLTRSRHGQLRNIVASAQGLGLRRIGQSAVVADTPENRGMINAARHMLKVENAS
jgi:large subunit ribosomal protein L30